MKRVGRNAFEQDDGFSFLEQAVFVETLCLLLCTATKGLVKGH
jgi:hypothetical protein